MERITASTQKQEAGSRKTRQRINSGRENCLQSLFFLSRLPRRSPFIHHRVFHRPSDCCRDWADDTMRRWDSLVKRAAFLTSARTLLTTSGMKGEWMWGQRLEAWSCIRHARDEKH